MTDEPVIQDTDPFEDGYQSPDSHDPDESPIDKIAREYDIDPSFIQIHEDGSMSISDPVTGETYMDDDNTVQLDADHSDEPVVFVNKLDEVLKKSGYDVSEIDFGDGVVKPISELTEEEQIEILVQQLANLQPQPATPQSNLSPDEQNLVDFLRSGKSPRELAETILESDLSYKYSKMSDEDVVREYLTKDKPSYTPEEIEEEIEDMKSRGTKLAREAKDIRLKYASTAQIPQTEPSVDFEQEKTELLTYAQKVDVPVSIKNDVLNFILPKSQNEESELIKYMTTPDALFNIGYLLTQYENIQRNHQAELKLAEEKGRKKALGQL